MFRFKSRKASLIFLFLGLAGLLGLFLYLSVTKAGRPKSPEADRVFVHATVVTMNKDFDILNDGWVAVKDGKILGLGSGQPPYASLNTVDLNGKILMPGLVNTHSHAPMVLLRNLAEGLPLKEWLIKIQSFEAKLSADDVYWGSLLGEAEMIKSGTTAFNDMYFYPQSTAKAAGQAGMRATVRIPITRANGQLGLDLSLVKEYANHDLINFSLAPNPLLDYTPEELATIGRLARQENRLIHLHFEEDAAARQDALAKYQKTPLELLGQAGLLENRLVLVHGVDLTDEEFQTISVHPKVGISFNPISNMKLSGVIASVAKMLDRGVQVGFGTDSAASSGSLDLFSQINFAANGLLKCDSAEDFCQNRYAISPKEIMRMATLGGAQVLGLEGRIGSLEIGKRADMIVIDASQAHFTPLNDIYAALVYNTSGSDVVDVYIDGKAVMLGRRLITLDEKDIIGRVQEIANRIKSSH